MNTYEPDSVSPPWHTLEEMFQEQGLTLSEAAEKSNIRQVIMCEMLCGITPIKGEIAQRLEAAGFGPAEFWEARTKRYEEWLEKKRGENARN